MTRNLCILLAAALVVALPFLLRKAPEQDAWQAGDPVLVVVTPHNEAIRYEFGRGFSRWHEAQYGRPVRIDWRAIGGTTEIVRYIEAQYQASARAWWQRSGRTWTPVLADALLDRKLDPHKPPEEAKALARWQEARDLVISFRNTDDPAFFTTRLDIFFGGGEYDHRRIFQQGVSVPPWAETRAPSNLFQTASGATLIPERIAGETWRTETFFGNAVGTFGICYNLDRLKELQLDHKLEHWDDLADPALFRQVGIADPTKSGSIAKAFELIIHQKCGEAVTRAGFTREQVDAFEGILAKARLDPGVLPPEVPAAYQQSVEQGWLEGIQLVQRIGANARYFTDSASKVPIDVSMGNAAAGLAIDFYSRFQAQFSRAPDGSERMQFITPAGGSGVSCDPSSLLRGAPHRVTAVRFLEFLHTEDGQRLWNYRPGTPGGPEKFALRRLPIRRDFYPSADPAIQAAYERHRPYTADDLGAPEINPYAIAEQFTYRSRWTGAHFGIQRDLIRAMCMDASVELQAAWAAIIRHGGPEKNPEALALLQRMPVVPEPVTWSSVLSVGRKHDRLDYMREWTSFFRTSYREAQARAEGG